MSVPVGFILTGRIKCVQLLSTVPAHETMSLFPMVPHNQIMALLDHGFPSGVGFVGSTVKISMEPKWAVTVSVAVRLGPRFEKGPCTRITETGRPRVSIQ